MGSTSLQNTESVSWFGILTPWYRLACFHPLQALVIHRNPSSVTVVVYLTLATFLNYLKIHSGWILCLSPVVCAACLIWTPNVDQVMTMQTLDRGILKRLNFSLDFLLVQKTSGIIHLVKTLWSVTWLDEFTFWKVENWRALLASEHIAGK